jgi:hypothetical protein
MHPNLKHTKVESKKREGEERVIPQSCEVFVKENEVIFATMSFFAAKKRPSFQPTHMHSFLPSSSSFFFNIF